MYILKINNGHKIYSTLHYIADSPPCVTELQIPSTQLCINITVTFLRHMVTCFDPHLGHFRTNIAHKMNCRFL